MDDIPATTEETREEVSEASALIQQLADEREIIQIVDGVDVSVDAKDWTTCRAYFLDEIDVDFSSLVGGEPMYMKADDLVSGWQTVL